MDLGQKNTVSDNVHQAICDVVGDMEVQVGPRMMRAISRMLNSFVVLIMIAEALQSRMMVTNSGWLQFNSDKSLHPNEGCPWWSVCTTTFHHRWFVLYFLKKARL